MAKSIDEKTQLMLWGAGLLALYVWSKGGVANVLTTAGGALVDAAGNVTDAAGNQVANAVESIFPFQTAPAAKTLATNPSLTDDPYVTRWILDAPNGGQSQAQQWSTDRAYTQGFFNLPAGSGHEPAYGTAIWVEFIGTYDPATMAVFTG